LHVPDALQLVLKHNADTLLLYARVRAASIPPRRHGSFCQRKSSRGAMNRRHGRCLPPRPSAPFLYFPLLQPNSGRWLRPHTRLPGARCRRRSRDPPSRAASPRARRLVPNAVHTRLWSPLEAGAHPHAPVSERPSPSAAFVLPRRCL
jgi:hypothetical protein